MTIQFLDRKGEFNVRQPEADPRNPLQQIFSSQTHCLRNVEWYPTQKWEFHEICVRGQQGKELTLVITVYSAQLQLGHLGQQRTALE